MRKTPIEAGVWPDLVMIDGGKGQLSSATEVMTIGLEDPLVAIAKGPDRNAGREEFHQPGHESFTLPHNAPSCIICNACVMKPTVLPSAHTP